MKYYTGIDNSTLDHKVRIIDENGNCKSSFTIDNTFSGFEILNRKLSNYPETQIGFELSQGPIVDYLYQNNYNIYSINPLKIKRYKEALVVSGNKTDNIDALAIAEFLRNNSSYCRKMVFNSPSIERLKFLCSIHSKLTKEHSRYINKLHAALRDYFPLHETLFSQVGGVTQLKMLLAYPTWSELRALTNEQIIDFLKENKYRRKSGTEKIIHKIRNYDQLISEDFEYAKKYEVICLCEILMNLNKHLTVIKKEMNGISNNHELGKIFKSLPGSGEIMTNKLLALFGDNKDRFQNANSAQCLFGTAPKSYQSGTYHRVIMRKACNKVGRDILFKFSFSSMLFSPWAREYYDRQRLLGKRHSAAVRSLSNKWVRVIYKLWKDELIYDETKKITLAA